MVGNGVVPFTDETFATEVEGGQGLVVVDFWAPWCGPCRMVAPVIEQLASEYAGRVRFGKLNVDENVQTSSRYGIRSIPTIGIFKDGELVGGVVGAVPKSYLEQLIVEHLPAAEGAPQEGAPQEGAPQE